MLALTGCTGKLGGATLSALLKNNLLPPFSLIICTSNPTSPNLTSYKEAGIPIRHFNFNSPSPTAFTGCTALFLVSTPAIALDFNNTPSGSGREKHHIDTINAAVEAGVKHVYYTSLAFGAESSAAVMTAHLRTEAFLAQLEREKGVKSTVIKEGVYSESWPLYLGYFDPKGDEREEIVLAGDGKISWTSIRDLGLANALVLSDEPGRWEGKTVYLSSTKSGKTLNEIAELVGSIEGKKLDVKIVSRAEHVEYYVERGSERESVEWWSSTYDSLKDGECDINDRTLEELLEHKGMKPKPVEETVREMLNG